MKIDNKLRDDLSLHMLSCEEHFSLNDIKWIRNHMPVVQKFFQLTDKERKSNNLVGASLVAGQIRWKSRKLSKSTRQKFLVDNNSISLMAHAYNSFGKARNGYFHTKGRAVL